MRADKTGLWPLTQVDAVLVGLIVAWGFIHLAPDIAHDRIWDWDESFHQVVTRHVHDHPLTPMLFDDPVHPLQDLRQWYAYNVWLHKPPLPFWLGAFFMCFTGPSPVDFRLGGLLSSLLAGLTVYLLGRGVVARGWAFLAALGFLALPEGWIFTQARFVGDITDLMLMGCTCLAVLCLLKAIQARSARWALAAGAATGLGYLSKTFLALTPIGLAFVLWGLGVVRFCRGPRLKLVALVIAGALAVAGPWNVYAAVKWPALYHRVLVNTLGFVSKDSGEDVGSGKRPVDAIFNESNQHAYRPMSHVAALVIGVWLVVRAVRKRELLVVACAIWLWATWLGNSLVAVKASSHIWNSMVPGFFGVALLLSDMWRSRTLAFAVAGGLTTPWFIDWFPILARLREMVPLEPFNFTNRIPGLVEGTVVVPSATLFGALLDRIRPLARRLPSWIFAAPTAGLLLWITLVTATKETSKQREEAALENNLVHSRDVGRALDAHTPAKSVLVFPYEYDPPHQHEHFNLMFWSDRLRVDPQRVNDYVQAGYHAYLVSARAEPFAPLEGVPPYAWMRAYDLAAPLPAPPPPPADASPLDVQQGNLHLLAWSAGKSDSSHDHWAFYVRPDGIPVSFEVHFLTQQGEVPVTVYPEATLWRRDHLARVPWFVVPVVGPHRSDVLEMAFGTEPGQRVRL